MKIRSQSYLFLLISTVIIAVMAQLFIAQMNESKSLAAQLNTKQETMLVLMDLQVSATKQVVYGVNMIRTKDISEKQLVPFRMAQTKFKRLNEELESSIQENPFRKELSVILKEGNKLVKVCQEKLLEPLYNHVAHTESLIEDVIYGDLSSLEQSINQARLVLEDELRNSLKAQQEQQKKFQYIILPLLISSSLVLVILFFLLFRTTLKSLNSTQGYLSHIAEGKIDLNLEIPTEGKNEIAVLRRTVNSFIKSLKIRYKIMKKIAKRLVNTGNKLSEMSLENSAAVSQMSRNISGLNDLSATISTKVDSSLSEIKSLSVSFEKTKTISAQQSENIKNIRARGSKAYNTLHLQNQSMENLITISHEMIEESRNTQQSMKAMTKQVEEILSQSTDIDQIIQTIQNIADETDILAINASIEASHAGEFGRGFTVVSGEMRKLAQAVRQNSLIITALLAELIEKVNIMSDREKENVLSHDHLMEQNTMSAQSIEELIGINQEVQITIQELSNELGTIHEGSQQVHSGTTLSEERIETVGDNMKTLSAMQHDLLSQSMEMKQGVNSLRDSIDTLGEMSTNHSETAQQLNCEIRKMGESAD